LYAVDAQTGRLLKFLSLAGDIGNTAAIVDGVAYIKSDNGYLYALH